LKKIEQDERGGRMAFKILQVIWKFKAWILVGILAITVGIQYHLHKREVFELEALISSAGVDVMTCKGNLALCEQQFRNLSAQCRLKCPDMAGDINRLESEYEASKRDLNEKNREIKGLIKEIEKIRQENVEAGKIVWADSPTAMVNQLQNMLGDKWNDIIAKIKKDCGINRIETTGEQIAEFAHRFRYYPKAKLGIGYNLEEPQANVGISFFSYGKDRAIDKTILDIIELYAGIGMKENGVKFGVVPLSINLGSFLPVIKDLDLAVGYQIDTSANRSLMIGITSTF